MIIDKTKKVKTGFFFFFLKFINVFGHFYTFNYKVYIGLFLMYK
jgi:hypothetical protein